MGDDPGIPQKNKKIFSQNFYIASIRANFFIIHTKTYKKISSKKSCFSNSRFLPLYPTAVLQKVDKILILSFW